MKRIGSFALGGFLMFAVPGVFALAGRMAIEGDHMSGVGAWLLILPLVVLMLALGYASVRAFIDGATEREE